MEDREAVDVPGWREVDGPEGVRVFRRTEDRVPTTEASRRFIEWWHSEGVCDPAAEPDEVGRLLAAIEDEAADEAVSKAALEAIAQHRARKASEQPAPPLDVERQRDEAHVQCLNDREEACRLLVGMLDAFDNRWTGEKPPPQTYYRAQRFLNRMLPERLACDD